MKKFPFYTILLIIKRYQNNPNSIYILNLFIYRLINTKNCKD